MSRRHQPDLFGMHTDLLSPAPPKTYAPSLEKVRVEVNKVLEKARIARDMPWTAKEVAFWKTVFPQMTKWLPEDEAAKARTAFWEEIERLESSPPVGSASGTSPSQRKKRSAAG